MQFMGRFEFALDPKGRLNIPSKFREILRGNSESSLVVTNFDGYLPVYPRSEWSKLEDRVSRAPTVNVNVSNFIRLFFGSASEVSMDRQGRILIPQSLRDYASLDKDVVITGVGRKFEVWSRDAYFQNFQECVEMMKDEGAREEIHNIIGI